MTHAASELTNSIAGPSVDTKGEIIIFIFLLRSNKRNARRDSLKARDLSAGASSAEAWNDKSTVYIARMQRHAAYHLKHESFPRA